MSPDSPDNRLSTLASSLPLQISENLHYLALIAHLHALSDCGRTAGLVTDERSVSEYICCLESQNRRQKATTFRLSVKCPGSINNTFPEFVCIEHLLLH